MVFAWFVTTCIDLLDILGKQLKFPVIENLISHGEHRFFIQIMYYYMQNIVLLLTYFYVSLTDFVTFQFCTVDNTVTLLKFAFC